MGVISNLVIEPIKTTTGKKNLSKGITFGINKGLLCLIIKPNTGNIDVVTMVRIIIIF